MADTPEKKESRLAKTIEDLGKYYNIRAKSAFINMLIDMEQGTGAKPAKTISEQTKNLQEKPPAHKLGELFLDVTEGATTIKEMLAEMEKVAKDASADDKKEIGDLFQVVYEPSSLASEELKLFSRCLVKPGKIGKDKFSGAYSFDGSDGEPKGESTAHFGDGSKDPRNYGGPYEKIWKEGKQGSMKTMMFTLPVDAAEAEKRTRERANGGSTDTRTATDEEAYLGVNKNPDSVGTKSEPNVISFCINDPHLSPATKDSTAVALWLSYIPTLEISRAQVYLDVQIVTNRPPVEEIGSEEKISTLSLMQFLEGNRSITGDPKIDGITVKAVNASMLASPQYSDPPKATDPPLFASAGMELFTSPQTLVNAGDFSGEPDMTIVTSDSTPPTGATLAPRAAPVLDRFRPLATMTGFSLDVAPAGGMMSMKTATLELVLHDRSRLAEMSQLIKPDIYGDTELLITYGWSHPDLSVADDVYQNPFAAIADAMKITEKFKVRNSSFSFDENGQAEISIELYTVSDLALDTNDISKGPGVEDVQKKVRKLIRTIRQIRRRLNPPSQKGSSDVSGETWLNEVTSVNAIHNMDADTVKAMKSWRKKVREDSKSADTQELIKSYDALFGKKRDGSDGALSVLSRTITQSLDRKQEMILSPESGDPYWVPILHDDMVVKITRRGASMEAICNARRHVADPHGSYSSSFYSGLRDNSRYGKWKLSDDPKKHRAVVNKLNGRYVSLGKLVATYVLAPLASSEMFDEIQVFYYTFNEHASFMACRNIAEFPVDFLEFSLELSKITRESAYVPLKRFLGMVNSKFISKTHNAAYGMSSLYKPNDEGVMQLSEAMKKSPTAFNDEKHVRLATAYGHNMLDDANSFPTEKQRFKKPRLAMTTEVVAAKNPDADKKRSAKDISILKIHIYDKACTPYNTMQDLLKAAKNESMKTLNTEARAIIKTPAEDRTTKMRAELIKTMESTGLISPAKEASVAPVQFQVKGGISQIKNFIRSQMPSIIYGSQYSGVIEASVSSMNDPQMATIHMLRSGKNDAMTPMQTRAAGLPLRVAPVEVSVKIFGCPVVSFGQQFFIDFGTGTSVDNVYAITGIKHNLAPGEFTTDLTLVALDAYGVYESALNVVSQAMQTTAESGS